MSGGGVAVVMRTIKSVITGTVKRIYGYCPQFGTFPVYLPVLALFFGVMGKKAEEVPGAFSIAVAKGIADAIDLADMSQAAVARRSGMSATYLGERLLLRKSFTLHDIEKLSRTLHLDPVRFLIDVDVEPLDLTDNVTQLRPNDGGFLDDAVQGLDAAAGSDETQAEEHD